MEHNFCDMLCDTTQARTHRIAYNATRFHVCSYEWKPIRTRGVVCYSVLFSAQARILLLTEGLLGSSPTQGKVIGTVVSNPLLHNALINCSENCSDYRHIWSDLEQQS